MAALHFLLPTGDRRSGRRSLIPNSSPFSRSTRFPFPSTASPPASLAIRKAPSECGIHRAEAASALRSRKTQRAAKEKSTPISQIFKAPTQRVAPQLAATPWGGSPPRPLCQKICYSDCTENCPRSPLRAPRRFRNPKIRQQLGAQPTPRFRVMIEALHDALLDAVIDPWPPFTFCCPQAIVDQDAEVSIPN